MCARINISKCISANTFIPHGHMGRRMQEQRHVLANTHILGSLLIFSVVPPPHRGKCLHFPIQYEPISVCFRVEVKRSIFSPSRWLSMPPAIVSLAKDTVCSSV